MATLPSDEIMSQLQDIRGLDPIGWWPLAPGWWLIIGGSILLLLILALLIDYLRHYPIGSWQAEARRTLKRLRRNSPTMPEKQVVAELSETLRRIAIALRGRERIAGLSGDDWLQWLEQTDPNGYSWSLQQDNLLNLPYAPPGHRVDNANIAEMIDAALAMVAKSRRQRPVMEAQDV